MKDPREFFYFLALQRIFCQRSRIGFEILLEESCPSKIFGKDRERFVAKFGTERALYERFLKFDDWKNIEKEYNKIKKSGFNIFSINDEEYPSLLKDIYDPPLLIYVAGENLTLLGSVSVAIVGSRKATEHGRRTAVEIAEYLSSKGVTVVSGMAYGIDAAAHRGAISRGGGTIAVWGTGLDVIYPAGHADLSREIMKNGLIISEYVLGTGPHNFNFPQRNRVVCGMSVGTVIIEAAQKSGSLISARLAVDSGREVMAVPGLADHPSYRGTNALIRDGALLVEKGEDVFKIIEKFVPKGDSVKKTGLFENDVDKDMTILNVLKKFKGLSVDEIVAKTKLSVTEVLGDLSKYVIVGMVSELPGRRFCLRGLTPTI